MTKQLKCWKKIVSNREALVFKHSANTKLDQNLDIWKQDYINKKGQDWFVERSSEHLSKDFKTKKEAIKFANNYMKKHDRC